VSGKREVEIELAHAEGAVDLHRHRRPPRQIITIINY
jgi:hypothetical protein